MSIFYALKIEDTLRLIEDDPTLGVIGIWGPGGVGKTHLLKKNPWIFQRKDDYYMGDSIQGVFSVKGPNTNFRRAKTERGW